jgi:hypothetical protein
MNGAKPDAVAKISNNPNTNRTATMGINHHNLRDQRNPNNSPPTPKFDFMLSKNFRMFFS